MGPDIQLKACCNSVVQSLNVAYVMRIVSLVWVCFDFLLIFLKSLG